MRLWVVKEDPRTSQLANDHRSTGRVLNGMEIFEASMTFNTARVGDAPRSDPYPPHFPAPRVKGLTSIRFLPDAAAPADLFFEAAAPTVLLATDALAGRVLESGCTGVQFRHPLWFAAGLEHVVRTRDGAARVIWDGNGRDYAPTAISLDEADSGPPGYDG